MAMSTGIYNYGRIYVTIAVCIAYRFRYPGSKNYSGMVHYAGVLRYPGAVTALVASAAAAVTDAEKNSICLIH